MSDKIIQKIREYTNQIKTVGKQDNFDMERQLIDERNKEIENLRAYLTNLQNFSCKEIILFLEEVEELINKYQADELCMELKSINATYRSKLLSTLYKELWEKCGFYN